MSKVPKEFWYFSPVCHLPFRVTQDQALLSCPRPQTGSLRCPRPCHPHSHQLPPASHAPGVSPSPWPLLLPAPWLLTSDLKAGLSWAQFLLPSPWGVSPSLHSPRTPLPPAACMAFQMYCVQNGAPGHETHWPPASMSPPAAPRPPSCHSSHKPGVIQIPCRTASAPLLISSNSCSKMLPESVCSSHLQSPLI